MTEIIISLILGFLTLIIASIFSSYVNGRRLTFGGEVSFKDILGSLIYFAAGTLFALHLFMIKTNEQIWIYIPIYVVVFISLLYLTVWDIQTLSIPSRFTNLFLLFVVVLNFIVGLTFFIQYRNTGMNTLANLPIGTLGNIIAGLGLGGIIYLLHRFTKGDGIGDGDIYIYAAIGFAMGLPMSLGFLIISSLLGGIVALSLILFYWKERGKILKTRIPLLPIIFLGFVLTLVFQSQVYLFWGI